jgi:type IV pilus assembly protein PilV
MNKIMQNSLPVQNEKGFSLLEVLLGVSVFMIGMLGVTALNISSMKSNTFSGNLSEATVVAASKIEELMSKPFDDADLNDADGDGTNQDTNDDGTDNNGGNFGLDDFGADADHPDTVVKNNITYTVYWNVAENEPISTDPERTKLINVIVEWRVKDEPRRISMSTIRQKE